MGQDFGLTAQEMNFVLKEEGYLQGEPGNYSVTEKGQQFADEQYHHRGTGGYSHYNRSWETRTWDDCITDNLDITVKKKREIQEAIFLAKKRQKEDLDCISPGVDKNFDTTDSGYEYCENQDDNGVLVDAGSIFLILVVVKTIRTTAHPPSG